MSFLYYIFFVIEDCWVILLEEKHKKCNRVYGTGAREIGESWFYGFGFGAVDAAAGAHAAPHGGPLARAHAGAAREAGAGLAVPAARPARAARAARHAGAGPAPAAFRPDAPPGQHLHP